MMGTAVEGKPTLRKIEKGAVINTAIDELQAYKIKKKQMKKLEMIDVVRDDVANLKSELSDIKYMLEQLLKR
jgi:hypothetical protein